MSHVCRKKQKEQKKKKKIYEAKYLCARSRLKLFSYIALKSLDLHRRPRVKFLLM